MTYWLSGCILYVTFTALAYGVRPVWTRAEFANYWASLPTAMDVDTATLGARFTGGGQVGSRTRRV